jgi:chromosome segregation ATPase
MIEQAMIFALGFLLAGLVALALVPAFWRRAIGLTRRRLEAQVPVSIQEILAERDQLRAQNAVECRRLEDRAAALNRVHAVDLSELGRRAVQIVTLEADLAARAKELSVQIAENKRQERELAEVQAEAAAADKALFDAEAIYKRQRDEILDRNEALSSLSALAEVRLASLTTSENYAKGLERHLAALRAELAKRQNHLREKTRETNQLADLLGIARSDLTRVQKKLDVEAARAADLEAGMSALRAARTANAAVAESNENALLRQSIDEIGAAMIRFAQVASEPAPPVASEVPKPETNGAGLWIVAGGEPPREIGLGPHPTPAEENATAGEARDEAKTPLDIRNQVEI